jgi:GntR family transcriptional regulator
MEHEVANRQPRYLQMAAQLTAEIEGGRYPVGSLLPTERELCRMYGCSRHTAREALRLLTERGLLARRQGSGSVVRATRATGRYVQSVESLNELIRYTVDARLDVLGSPTVVSADVLPLSEGVAPGTVWIRIEGLRKTDANASAICWTVIYLRVELEIIVPQIGKRPIPVYSLIEEATGTRIMEVIQIVDATRVPRAIAGILGCRPGSAALHTTRRYVGHNHETLMIAESIHPAGRTRFMTTLRRRPTDPGQPDRE